MLCNLRFSYSIIKQYKLSLHRTNVFCPLKCNFAVKCTSYDTLGNFETRKHTQGHTNPDELWHNLKCMKLILQILKTKVLSFIRCFICFLGHFQDVRVDSYLWLVFMLQNLQFIKESPSCYIWMTSFALNNFLPENTTLVPLGTGTLESLSYEACDCKYDTYISLVSIKKGYRSSFVFVYMSWGE